MVEPAASKPRPHHFKFDRITVINPALRGKLFLHSQNFKEPAVSGCRQYVSKAARFGQALILEKFVARFAVAVISKTEFVKRYCAPQIKALKRNINCWITTGLEGNAKLLVSIIDRMMFGDRQVTADGYLATVGKISRSGTQEYLGSELGRPELDRVTVYRDADEVFDEDAIRSFAYKPVTDDHPPVSVTSKNWRTYSRGQLGGKALRDGDHLEFPMVIMDQGLIDKINNGKAELSAGYTAEIEFVDGVAPDGTPYQAKMTKIRGNHTAVVAKGRALTARIGDAWPTEIEDSTPPTKPKKERSKMPTLMLDGLKVDLQDEEAVSAAFKKLTDKAEAAADDAKAARKELADANTAHETALADSQKAHDKEMGVKDAEIADLKGKVMDQAAIDKLADAKADIVASARKVLGDKAPDFAGKTVAEVRRTSVAVKFGDAAVEGKSDDYVEARFDAMIAAPSQQSDPYRQAMGDRKTVDMQDAAAASRNARLEMIKGYAREDAE